MGADHLGLRPGSADALHVTFLRDPKPARCEQHVRVAQKMEVGPCIPVGAQLERAEVGPTSGPTWRLSHTGVRCP